MSGQAQVKSARGDDNGLFDYPSQRDKEKSAGTECGLACWGEKGKIARDGWPLLTWGKLA
jgi:hypothetical protein